MSDVVMNISNGVKDVSIGKIVSGRCLMVSDGIRRVSIGVSKNVWRMLDDVKRVSEGFRNMPDDKKKKEKDCHMVSGKCSIVSGRCHKVPDGVGKVSDDVVNMSGCVEKVLDGNQMVSKRLTMWSEFACFGLGLFSPPASVRGG